MDRPRLRRWLLRSAGAAVVLFGLLQLVPYGWTHSNPPVVEDTPWPDARSATVARQSCYSCHSNETDWPAYSYLAPMSWLVRNDVDRARDELNFSDWDEAVDELDDAVEMVDEGSMPPRRYTAIYREAALDDEEEQVLLAALRQLDGDDDD